jgi:hypothetical protein
MKKGRALIVLLLVLVIVGGVVLSSVLIFRVQDIKVTFTNDPVLIVRRGLSLNLGVDSRSVEATQVGVYERRVRDAVGGKNILFDLDRELITSIIEEDPLLRVTNIEAKFPNRLEIKVQERYALFMYRSFDDPDAPVAVLDRELRVISTEVSIVAFYGNLIDLTNQFTHNNMPFEVGKSLQDFVMTDGDAGIASERMETLVTLWQFFGDQSQPRYSEEWIRHLIQGVEFTANDFEIRIKDRISNREFITIVIKGHSSSFGDKINLAWNLVENYTNFQAGTLVINNDISHAWLNPGEE